MIGPDGFRNWRSKTSDRKELKSTSGRAARDGRASCVGAVMRKGRREYLPAAPAGLKIHWISNTDQSPVFQAYGRYVAAELAISEAAAADLLTKGLMIKTSNGNAIQNPLVATANKAACDMVRYASEFGLTPSARARLALTPQAPKRSRFDGLIG
jgi:P27 family predicted phage terminase small subunit